MVDQRVVDVAMEDTADLCSGEAVLGSLKSLEAIGDGVSDAGAEERGRGVGTVVPGRVVCLGRQPFPLLVYLRQSRRRGSGYAHPQVSYYHLPRLRLLVPDTDSPRRQAVPWREDLPR
jgi:hypothetical protein